MVREVVALSVRSLFHTFFDICEKGDQVIDLTGLRIQIIIDAGAFFPTFYDPGVFQYLHMMGYCRTGKIGLFSKFNDPASTAFSLEHDTEEMLSGFISNGSEDLLAGPEFFFKSLYIFPCVFQCNAPFCLNS